MIHLKAPVALFESEVIQLCLIQIQIQANESIEKKIILGLSFVCTFLYGYGLQFCTN